MHAFAALFSRGGFSMRHLHATLAVGLVFLLAPATAIPASQHVAIAGFAYEYPEVVVARDVPLIWENLDSAPHTVTSSFCTGGCSFDSPSIGPGGQFSFTPDDGGTIRYFCRVHGFMAGTLIVQTLDPDDPDLSVPAGGFLVRNDEILPGVPFPYRYRLEADVENAGGTTASVAVTFTYTTPTGSTGVIGSRTIVVPAGSQAKADLLWDASSHAPRPGSYRVDVLLDPGNAVIEGDETNNAASVSVPVQPGGVLGV